MAHSKHAAILALLAAVGISSCSRSVGIQSLPPPQAATADPSITSASTESHRFVAKSLYAQFMASYPVNRLSVAGYKLPLTDASRAVVTIPLASQGIGVAAADGALYVANDGKVLQYSLPLISAAIPSHYLNAFAWDVAVDRRYLYTTDSAAKVRAFRLPISPNEQAEASISLANPIGIAVHRHKLYVGSWTPPTLSVYKLPMRTNEIPEYTIALSSFPEGIAVNDTNIYVSIYRSSINVYSVQSHKLTTELMTAVYPFYLALDPEHLYVSDCFSQILVYALPLDAKEQASVTLSGLPAPCGLAVDSGNPSR